MELEQEILVRIDRRCALHTRGGRAPPRAPLGNERRNGPLLEVLDELERRGLIESALHFRLTERGHAQLPNGYQPPAALRRRDPVAGAVMNAGEARTQSSAHVDLVGEIQRGGGRLAEIARHLAPDSSRGRNPQPRWSSCPPMAPSAITPRSGFWWLA